MTYAPRPPRRSIAAFLDTVRWAGATIHDANGRLTVHGDKTGLLQVEVDRRAAAIREWWQQQAEQEEVQA
jgi:hypothetical protein